MPDAGQFVKKHGQGQYSNDQRGHDWTGDDWKGRAICYGCGVMGHIKAKCRSKHKLAMYEKSKSGAILATSTSIGESEPFLFSVIHLDPILVRHLDPVLVIHSDPVLDCTPDSVITLNVVSTNQSADYWILDTCSTNHITGNRHLCESFDPMTKGEHQVKTANNSFEVADGSRTIRFYVNRPNAKPAKIVMQCALYVPSCCMNNLHSIIQSIWKEDNKNFKLDGAPVSVGSVLIYEAPLINCLFVLKASTI